MHLDKEGKLKFFFSVSPVKEYIPFPNVKDEGYIFEYSRYIHLLITDIFTMIKEIGGTFLIIDYAKSKKYNQSTLSGIYNHTHVDPFFLPGKTDLSTKVDFDFVKSVANYCDCKVIGPFSQRFFLRKLGIEQRFKQLIKFNPELSNSFLAQQKRLIGKNYMGEIFKVLIITNKTNKDLIFENE